MKTQEEKYIYNVFFTTIALVVSIVMGILRGLKTFLKFPVNSQNLKLKRHHKFMHFFVYEWPKNFWNSPSLYKIFRFPGDIIHYLFLKK